MIAVAHRLATIQKADVIFVLGSGKVLEKGGHQELLRRRGVYWQMVSLLPRECDVCATGGWCADFCDTVSGSGFGWMKERTTENVCLHLMVRRAGLQRSSAHCWFSFVFVDEGIQIPLLFVVEAFVFSKMDYIPV